MKFVLIIGSGAVGKMTVGQELAKITELSLFHNHMAIEPVLEVFGEFKSDTIKEIRDVIFRDFAKSDKYGLIFTFMWGFGHDGDREYIEHIKSIFDKYDTEYYCVELIADKEVRKERNRSENRLLHKPSKRDIEASEKREELIDENFRLVSLPGEIPFENYLRIDNTSLSAKETAQMIKEAFKL